MRFLSPVLILATLVLPAFAQEAEKADAAPKTLPLKPERKISFTTDEGTWLAVDLSPDGKTILFELLGDIYTVPAAGGKATLLLGGMSMDTQPVYSPDGKWFAFLSDRDGAENLWIAKADGTGLKQLTKGTKEEFASPAWSPDGLYIAVSRASSQSGTNEIWMYHRDGGSGIQVTKALTGPPREGPAPSADRENSLGADFSRDGKYLYFARRRAGFTYNASFPLWQIVRRNRSTGEEDVITDALGSAMRPRVSPDGTKLVFLTRFETQTGLRMRDLQSGDERWLRYPVQRDDQEARATRDTYPNYCFTPDGKELILTFGGKIQRLDIATGSAKVIPFEAEVTQDLGPLLDFQIRVEDGPVKVRLAQNPALSPDGKRIVFSALRRLYTMTLPNGTPQRVTSDANAHEFSPSWSPDGRSIIYVSWTNAGGQIMRVAADSNQPATPETLTRAPAFYVNPVVTPDGTKIVASRSPVQSQLEGTRQAASSDLIWIPSNGGNATIIAPARGAGRPHFVTSQPDRIYLTSQRGLVSLRYDGSDRRTHLRVNSGGTVSLSPEPSSAEEILIHPDGGSVLALASHQLYLIPLPQAGGDSPNVDVTKPQVPVKKLTEIGADSIQWADGGRTIAWAAGAHFFRLSTSSVTFEAKDKVTPEEIAIDIERPRAKPEGTVVLRGAKVITMKGEETIADADVVITGNRIAAVGKRGSVTIPSGAAIQDVRGHVIMPGIVDVHAHWRVQTRVLEEQSWAMLANLAYGVTSGRDPQTGTYDIFGYQDLIDTGEMLGPRAFSTGPGVFGDTNFQSFEGAKSALARYAKYYRTNTLKSYIVGNRKQRQWVIQASKELQLMPTTEGALDLKLDMTHAIDGFSGNEHALSIVPLYKDVVQLFAKSGISYTPTLLVAYGGPWAENYFYETTEVYGDAKLKRFLPYRELYSKAVRRPWFREDEHVFPKLAESAGRIIRAGGRVGIGGHGQLQGIQCHWEMWALKTGGLTNYEVLRAATIDGATAIGYRQDLGSIEPGKLADLIVLKKDPLDDIHNTNTIRYVMKNGQMFEGDSMDEVWPAKKKLPAMWWWGDRPTPSNP